MPNYIDANFEPTRILDLPPRTYDQVRARLMSPCLARTDFSGRVTGGSLFSGNSQLSWVLDPPTTVLDRGTGFPFLITPTFIGTLSVDWQPGTARQQQRFTDLSSGAAVLFDSVVALAVQTNAGALVKLAIPYWIGGGTGWTYDYRINIGGDPNVLLPVWTAQNRSPGTPLSKPPKGLFDADLDASQYYIVLSIRDSARLLQETVVDNRDTMITTHLPNTTMELVPPIPPP